MSQPVNSQPQTQASLPSPTVQQPSPYQQPPNQSQPSPFQQSPYQQPPSLYQQSPSPYQQPPVQPYPGNLGSQAPPLYQQIGPPSYQAMPYSPFPQQQQQSAPPYQSVPSYQPTPLTQSIEFPSPFSQYSAQNLFSPSPYAFTQPPPQLSYGNTTKPTIQLLNPKPDLPLSAVIVTIFSNASYDAMFRSVPQEGPKGTKVNVYSLDSNYVSTLAACMEEKQASTSGELSGLLADLKSIPPASVCFNWECCSDCSDSGFVGRPTFNTVEFMETLIKKGFMVMCSDFSLKALLSTWNSPLPYLGSNPFQRYNDFSDHFQLYFDVKTLKQCSSAQLQMVGKLCEKGTCSVHALGGTISYGVKNFESEHFKLEVLTVATHKGMKATPCTIGEHKGVAGHVLLTYPSGGKLLTSCGHWAELSKLDVSVETILKVAETSYGTAYSSAMASNISAMAPAQQQTMIQQYASQIVQQTSPQTYSGF